MNYCLFALPPVSSFSEEDKKCHQLIPMVFKKSFVAFQDKFLLGAGLLDFFVCFALCLLAKTATSAVYWVLSTGSLESVKLAIVQWDSSSERILFLLQLVNDMWDGQITYFEAEDQHPLHP